MALSIDDPRLVESFRAGENEAFEALVRAHRPALYRHALRKLSDHAAAEDAVQETFTRAYKGRARVGDDWRLGAWLHQICANVCIDEANRRRRESTKSSRWATAEVDQHTAPTLEDQLGLDADHSDVVRALRGLPDNFQEALELRYVAELEYDEMAEVLEISEDNARARVSRASKAIRVLLRPVAAIIAFFAAFSFRRGGKGERVLAATAQSAGDSATTATAVSNVTTVATQVSHSASLFAPLVETAQAVAIQAPQAMPLISKAAIGLGMVVVATSPATAPIVIDQFRDTAPAPVTARADTPQDAAAPVTAAPAPAVSAPPASTPTDAAAGSSGSSAATNSNTSGNTEGSTGTGGANSASGSSGSGSVVPVTTIPAITRNPGTLGVSSLTVVQSGPRLDVSGSATLTAGGQTVSGALTGRLSLSGTPDSRGRQRLDATFTITTADGPIDIRVAGYATAKAIDPAPAPAPADGEAPASSAAPAASVAPAPTSYSLSGVFRATADKFGLITSGSASGTLGSGLTLNFAV